MKGKEDERNTQREEHDDKGCWKLNRSGRM